MFIGFLYPALLLRDIEFEQRSVITTIGAPQRLDVTTPDIPVNVQRLCAPVHLLDTKEVLPDKFSVDPGKAPVTIGKRMYLDQAVLKNQRRLHPRIRLKLHPGFDIIEQVSQLH